jgi:selenocysteine-specific elongation factor
LAGHPWLAELRAAPFQPPASDGVPPAEVSALVRQGAVVEVDGIYFAAEAIEDLSALVARELEHTPEGITMAGLRDLIGATRKYALALGKILDQRGITARRGDVRIAGPRLRHSMRLPGSPQPDEP